MSCRLLVVCKECPNRRDLKSIPKGFVRKMFTSWDSGCSFIRQRVLHRNVACQWNARTLKHSSSPGGVGWSWVLQVSQYFQQQLHLASKGRFDTSACISLKSWGMVRFGMEMDGERKRWPTYALKTGPGVGSMPSHCISYTHVTYLKYSCDRMIQSFSFHSLFWVAPKV